MEARACAVRVPGAEHEAARVSAGARRCRGPQPREQVQRHLAWVCTGKGSPRPERGRTAITGRFVKQSTAPWAAGGDTDGECRVRPRHLPYGVRRFGMLTGRQRFAVAEPGDDPHEPGSRGRGGRPTADLLQQTGRALVRHLLAAPPHHRALAPSRREGITDLGSVSTAHCVQCIDTCITGALRSGHLRALSDPLL